MELAGKTENRDIKSMTLPELREALQPLGVPRYRADQLYRWMHVQLAESPEQMSNLPRTFRQQMEELGEYVTLRTVDRQISRMDGTQKFLFALPDDNLVESVFMR